MLQNQNARMLNPRVIVDHDKGGLLRIVSSKTNRRTVLKFCAGCATQWRDQADLKKHILRDMRCPLYKQTPRFLKAGEEPLDPNIRWQNWDRFLSGIDPDLLQRDDFQVNRGQKKFKTLLSKDTDPTPTGNKMLFAVDKSHATPRAHQLQVIRGGRHTLPATNKDHGEAKTPRSSSTPGTSENSAHQEPFCKSDDPSTWIRPAGPSLQTASLIPSHSHKGKSQFSQQ